LITVCTLIIFTTTDVLSSYGDIKNGVCVGRLNAHVFLFPVSILETATAQIYAVRNLYIYNNTRYGNSQKKAGERSIERAVRTYSGHGNFRVFYSSHARRRLGGPSVAASPRFHLISESVGVLSFFQFWGERQRNGSGCQWHFVMFRRLRRRMYEINQ